MWWRYADTGKYINVQWCSVMFDNVRENKYFNIFLKFFVDR